MLFITSAMYVVEIADSISGEDGVDGSSSCREEFETFESGDVDNDAGFLDDIEEPPEHEVISEDHDGGRVSQLSSPFAPAYSPVTLRKVRFNFSCPPHL